MFDLILISIALATIVIAILFYARRARYQVEILDDTSGEGRSTGTVSFESGIHVEDGGQIPWMELGRFENGMIVQFSSDLEYEKDCPWCQNPLNLPDPYRGDMKGWVCITCRTPHHLTCRERSKQCCSEFCFKPRK